MGSLEKIVKLACKPKDAPPKSKYLEPIIAATWDEEGAVHDVCRALQARFREPNAIVVFKALIVLHTMLQNGSTDNVLSYLSSSEVLHLRNVSSGTWEGYNAPQNMQHYAIYLDSRIRAYRDMKHDAIAVQSEANRDLRLSQNIDAELGRSRPRGKGTESSSTGGLQRGKTIAGRKLRVMTVEKGLLRETKAVQKQIDTLVECRFYLDDLQDPLTIAALRMLVQDLLILFSAGNEGVINVLEHYFEMSRVDAESALAVYRHFCKQCEKVVEFLGVAKKLQNLLNVPIPNMKHAPLSLAGALKEYLDDPNFEQNRIEYKLQKESADKTARNGRSGVRKPNKDTEKPAATSTTASTSPTVATNSVSSAPTPTSNAPQSVTDFFESIEQAQAPMFGNSPTAFQTPNMFNPFIQQQQTGMPFGQHPFGQQSFGQMQAQPTGFMEPQVTGFPGAAPNPFAPMQVPQQQTSPFGAFLQPQQPQGMLQVQATGFLQPQMTGANPFRPSGVMPQSTGMPSTGPQSAPLFGQSTSPFAQFAQGAAPAQNNSPFAQFGQNGQSTPAFGQNGTGQQGSLFAQPTGISAPSNIATSTNPFPFLSQAQPSGPSSNASMAPARPGSAPITSLPSTSPAPEPVKTHQTGSRNPFGPVVTPAPPVPKIPTLFDLMSGASSPNSNAPSPANDRSGFAAFEAAQNAKRENGTTTNGSSTGGAMSSVASSFSFGGSTGGPGANGLTPQLTSTTSTTSADSLFSSGLSSTPTGATTTSFTPSINITSPALKPQTTGFGGVKAFKPSSSFGASLLESLPPIPGSAPTTPGVETLTTSLSALHPNGSNAGASASAPTSGATSPAPAITGIGALNAQSTGFPSAFGVGLRPQATGAPGVANPFRSTVFGSASADGLGALGGLAPSQSMPLFGQTTGAPGVMPSFGASLFGAGAGGQGQQQPQPQQQQQQTQFGSLI